MLIRRLASVLDDQAVVLSRLDRDATLGGGISALEPRLATSRHRTHPPSNLSSGLHVLDRCGSPGQHAPAEVWLPPERMIRVA
jgi:hypothetical protein